MFSYFFFYHAIEQTHVRQPEKIGLISTTAVLIAWILCYSILMKYFMIFFTSLVYVGYIRLDLRLRAQHNGAAQCTAVLWSVYCPHLLVRKLSCFCYSTNWTLANFSVFICLSVNVCVCEPMCVLHKEKFSHFHPLHFSLCSSQWSFSHTYLLHLFDLTIKEQNHSAPLHQDRWPSEHKHK